MSVTAPTDPVSCLSVPCSPPDTFMSDTIASLDISVSGIDWALRTVIDWSPIEEWIVKPLAGDWETMQEAADGWKAVGSALAATAENLESIPSQLSERWEGKAADAFGAQNRAIVEKLTAYPAVCNSISEFLESLIEVMKSALKFIVETINLLVEYVRNQVTGGGWGIFGTLYNAASALINPSAVYNKIQGWAAEAAEAANRVIEAVNTFTAFLETLEDAAGGLGGLIKRLLGTFASFFTPGTKGVPEPVGGYVGGGLAGGAGTMRAV